MIQLKPNLEILEIRCPHCSQALLAKNFLLPGMRNLVDYVCANCDAEFYGDLPVGQAFYTPFLLNKKNGATFGDESAKWFADWLADSFQNRQNTPLSFEIRKFATVKNKVILLNCLDTLYGHCLLKLLNAQHYLDHKSDYSLIIIAPPFLEWMLPDGLAEAWIVDLPLRRGTEWNDWLAAEINRKLADFSEVYLSHAFSHPHPTDYEIERFTKIKPFDFEKFSETNDAPIVTFIWREDRLWDDENSVSNLKQKFGFTKNKNETQIEKVINLAEILRQRHPNIDFAVVGLGTNGIFPNWIKDIRKNSLSDTDEIEWCQRYAESHVVIGVHGSNMLLPSAHAGSVVELLPTDRQGNFLQDILLRPTDVRETLFRYRFTPLSTSPQDLAELVSIILRYRDFQKLMNHSRKDLLANGEIN